MVMIDLALPNQSPKAQFRFARFISGDGRTPSGFPVASMTISFDCHFAASEAFDPIVNSQRLSIIAADVQRRSAIMQ